MKELDLASSESMKYFSNVNVSNHFIILSIFWMFLNYFLLFSKTQFKT